MNWVKGFALVTCLATPMSVIVATSAMADPATTAAPTTAPPAGAMMKKSSMTEGQKKAKAADCSKQADAKKLHGEERRKFRQSCKKA